MDLGLFWRAAVVQAAAVAVLSMTLALTLPDDFFEEWGFVAGPGAWVACALLTARVLGLPLGVVAVGSVLAAVPAFLAIAIGVHWPGTVLAVLVFAAWCARVARDRGVLADSP